MQLSSTRIVRLSKFNFGNSYLDSIDLWLWRGVVDFNPGISQQAKAPPFLSREPDVVNRDNEPTSRTRYKRFVPPVLPALSASQSPRAATSPFAVAVPRLRRLPPLLPWCLCRPPAVSFAYARRA